MSMQLLHFLSYLKNFHYLLKIAHLRNTAIGVIADKGVNVDIVFALRSSWENGRKRCL